MSCGADFGTIVLGGRSGFVAVAFGYCPYRDQGGKYRHRGWIERRYSWSAGRDELALDVRQLVCAGERVDVYVCPAVRFTDDRRKGSALPPMVCWADIDGPAADESLLSTLAPFTVLSGSGGNRHVYLPLTRLVDLGSHKRLNQALAATLGADAKWSDESLLRLPGTFNYKVDPPVLVRPLPWSGRVWDPDELAMLLGVDHSALPPSRTPVVAVTEPVPDPLPIRVRWALAHPDVTDRSAAHHRLVGACRETGLTLGQALAVVAGYGPSREKYGARLAEETARSWGRVRPVAAAGGGARG
ncbi:MAG: hypothetical protein ACT4NY_20655 [Pseudonocardiales bacterium]